MEFSYIPGELGFRISNPLGTFYRKIWRQKNGSETGFFYSPGEPGFRQRSGLINGLERLRRRPERLNANACEFWGIGMVGHRNGPVDLATEDFIKLKRGTWVFS